MLYTSLEKNKPTHFYFEFSSVRTAPCPATAVKKYPASYLEIVFNNILNTGDNIINDRIPGNDIRCHLTGFTTTTGRTNRKCIASSL